MERVLSVLATIVLMIIVIWFVINVADPNSLLKAKTLGWIIASLGILSVSYILVMLMIDEKKSFNGSIK